MLRNLQRIALILVFFYTSPAYCQDDDLPNGKLAEASRAMKNRDYKEAEIIYRQLLKQNPEDMTLKQWLCHSLINQKEFNEADSMLWRMLETDSNNVGNYWYYGLSCERQNKDSIAADYFKIYIRKTENFTVHDVKSWLHVGSAYRRLMHDSGITLLQYNSMVYHYKKYLKLNPADAYAPELEAFLTAIAAKKPDPGQVLVWDEKN